MAASTVPYPTAAAVTVLIFATLAVLGVLQVLVGPNPLSANHVPVLGVVLGGYGVYRTVGE